MGIVPANVAFSQTATDLRGLGLGHEAGVHVDAARQRVARRRVREPAARRPAARARRRPRALLDVVLLASTELKTYSTSNVLYVFIY